MCPITCFIARAYGREDFMRSCALRILEAETISSARVTLRVFCTLLILVLISRPPAISLLALLAWGTGNGEWEIGNGGSLEARDLDAAPGSRSLFPVPYSRLCLTSFPSP